VIRRSADSTTLAEGCLGALGRRAAKACSCRGHTVVFEAAGRLISLRAPKDGSVAPTVSSTSSPRRWWIEEVEPKDVGRNRA